MAKKLTFSQSVNLDGASYTIDETVEGSVVTDFDEDVAATAATRGGTLTTRTDNTTGTLTLATGHGVTTASRIDIFWDGGTRYNVLVGTVSGNSVPISGGAGDNLPIATTAVVAATATIITGVTVDGDDLLSYVLAITGAGGPCQVTLMDNGGTPAPLVRYVINAGSGLNWYSGNGVTNPLAGDTVGSIHVSNGSVTSGIKLRGGFLT